jgi:hypothetical protein
MPAKAVHDDEGSESVIARHHLSLYTMNRSPMNILTINIHTMSIHTRRTP